MEYDAQFENANAVVAAKSVQDWEFAAERATQERLLLSVGEVADILSLSRSRIYELIYAG